MSNVSVYSKPNHKENVKPLPLGRQNHTKTPPPKQIFLQIQGKQQKLETEIKEGPKQRFSSGTQFLVEAAS